MTAQIEVEKLIKEYRVHERAAGAWASLRSLFRRQYKASRAVDELSFSIAPGERVGFLGPNGAGKTTTLKVLSGLLHPTSGGVRVAGHEPHLRAPAFLRNRAIYDIPKPHYDETVAELTRLLDLGPLLGKPTRQLSLGERMKCELAVALLHRPKVLFLDEPTIGLAVSMQAIVRTFVRQYNERFQATVILTSHY